MTGRTGNAQWYRVKRNDQEGYVAAALMTPARIEIGLGESLEIAALERKLTELERGLREARFEQVVAGATMPRLQLSKASRFVDLSKSVVRLERATGVALIGLGRLTEAGDCFDRAIEIDPTFTFDPARTSPKVLQVLDKVRTARL